ncbi:MAG: ATP-binding protein [Myxococcota bacterium]
MSALKSEHALATISNPFHGVVIQDVWQPLAFDIGSIHQNAFEQCLKGLDNVSAGKSDSLLIYGSPGTGKTHLISRFQQYLFATAKDAPDQTLRCVFVAVRLQSSPTTLWQCVRQRLATDLLRQEQGITQLQRLVAHQIAAERKESPRTWVRAMRVLTGTEGESVTEYLQRTAENLDLGRDLFVMLDHLVHRRYTFDATAWLKGDSLPEQVLAKLDVGADEGEEREEVARRVVVALCRLAGETLPLVFCFDQLESLQRYPRDTEAFFRFGRMAADLADADPNVLIISCMQSAFVDDLKTHMREADRDRVIKRQATLEPLNRVQLEELVKARLDGVPELKELRAKKKDPLFPIGVAFLDHLYQTSTRTPRKILAKCSDRFEELKTGSAWVSDSCESVLESEYLERRRAALEQHQPEDSTQTLTHGLPIAWYVFEKCKAFASLAALEASPADVVLPGAKGDFDVAICNERNMNSLAARFRRLLRACNDSHEGNSAQPPVVVRHAALEISTGAKRTREYLSELERRGCRLIQPDAESLAALEAVRSLMSDARSGDLSARGETLEPSEVSRWLLARSATALTPLLTELERGTSSSLAASSSAVVEAG